jgi:hypothetical protein
MKCYFVSPAFRVCYQGAVADIGFPPGFDDFECLAEFKHDWPDLNYVNIVIAHPPFLSSASLRSLKIRIIIVRLFLLLLTLVLLVLLLFLLSLFYYNNNYHYHYYLLLFLTLIS